MFSASIPRRVFGSSRMPIYSSAVLLLVVVLAHMAQSQIAEKLTQNPCSSKTSCHDCIQTKSCAWCSQPDYGDRPRCFSPSLTPYGGCAEEFTMNPDNVQVTLVNQTLTLAGAAARAEGHQSISGGSYEASGHRESYGSSSYTGQSYNRERQSSMSSGRKGYSQNVEYGSYSSSGRIIQIAPQRVSLKLRISMSLLSKKPVQAIWLMRCFFYHFYFE